MKNIYGVIYIIRNKVNNKLYIGQTTEKGGFGRRYRYNLAKNTHNKHLKSSIQKYGIENFEIDEEFDIAYSKEELDKLEDLYIKIFNTTNQDYGYNLKYGGSSGKCSEQLKEQMSETFSGENNPMYGKHHSEESREQMSQNRKGKLVGEDNPFYHKQHSKEVMDTIKYKNGKAVYCVELNVIKCSSEEMGRHLGLFGTSIRRCCRGTQKTAGGYHFRWATEEEIEKANKEDMFA